MAVVITNTGMAGVASRINGAGGEAIFDYIAVGTGTTGADAGDSALETELAVDGLSRAQDGTPTRETTTQTNDTATADITFTVTGSGQAVTEAGLLNAAAAGVLLVYDVFSAINVTGGDTLIITIKVQVTG